MEEKSCLPVPSLSESNIISYGMHGRTREVVEAISATQQPRRYPAAHVEAISEHVDNMLKQGTIEPASSLWASNVVMVKKTAHFGAVLIIASLTRSPGRRSLPRIDDCLDAMSSATLFSTFDLRSSYHQMKGLFPKPVKSIWHNVTNRAFK